MVRFYRRLALIAMLGAIGAGLRAQTTQSLIVGRIRDRHGFAGLARATVLCLNVATNLANTTETDAQGRYSLASLSPGIYVIRAELDGYQAQEIHELKLDVAARLELDFTLTPLNSVSEAGNYGGEFVPGANTILPLFGPDIETGRATLLDRTAARSNTLQPGLSYVVDPQQLESAPLLNRNVYTMMVTLPGVTAEGVTGRGLGLSVNGQRSSSSNFLLDGVENNDYLNTGPFTSVAPEGTQEYRISTNNYSAEFGRAGGFVANAVTRAGGSAFHGLGYAYLVNDALAANTFINNATSLPRQPLHQTYAGFSAGGPVWKNRLFFTSSFERFWSRSRGNPEDFNVPVLDGVQKCLDLLGSGPIAAPIRNLFSQRPPPRVSPKSSAACDGQSIYGAYTTTRPVTFNRRSLVERFDYRSPSGRQQLMGRLTMSRFSQPNFVFSVYPDSNAPLSRDTNGVSLSHVWQIRPRWMNELRAGWRNGQIASQPPHSDLPILQLDLLEEAGVVDLNLPGNLRALTLDFHENDGEVSDTLVIAKGRNTLTLGGGMLLRRPTSSVAFLPRGVYDFSGAQFQFTSPPQYATDNATSIARFGLNLARVARLPLNREALQSGGAISTAVDYARSYSNQQFFGFLQDSIKLGSKLTLSLGIRYETFGALTNTGVKDGYLSLSPGSSIEERLAKATLAFNGRDSAYRPDRNNWAPRFGASYDLFGNGRTVLRAGYGVYFDRLFDNLVLNPRNNDLIATFCADPVDARCASEFSYPASATKPGNTILPAVQNYPKVLRNIEQRVVYADFPEVLWIDQGMRTPYVQSWFGGIQQRVTRNLSVEISHMGSLGRKLIASDYVNRLCSVDCDLSKGLTGRLNPNFDDILHRSNSGSSDYMALGSVLRYSARNAQFQLSYTYSHSIDNQSDALLGDIFNLADTYPEGTNVGAQVATFTRQFDSRIDRGNSDFDLRHNVVFYSIWNSPRFSGRGRLRNILGGWQFSQLAGIRSGFPYTIYADTRADLPQVSRVGELIANRASVAAGQSALLETPEPVKGGKQFVNLLALRQPSPGVVGRLGRNSLSGPGFWNLDLSVARSIPAPLLGESGSVEIRADAFNVLNHANLGNANTLSNAHGRGPVYYGPGDGDTAFPAVAPLYPTPRRVQLQLKIRF